MTDLWEKVVLNLKIQAPKQPKQKLVGRIEIGGGTHLVQRPIACQFFFRWKMIDLDHVRQLKHHANEKPTNKSHHKKSNDGLWTNDVNWNGYKGSDIKQFRRPEYSVLLYGQRHRLHVRRNLIVEILDKIFVENPCQVRDAVQQEKIKMLKAMCSS
jgi:hypothetical protein